MTAWSRSSAGKPTSSTISVAFASSTPAPGVDRDLLHRVGVGPGDLLDLHATLDAGDAEVGAVGAVEQEGEVVLLLDRGAGDHQDPVDRQSLDLEGEDRAGGLLGLLRRLRDLHAAGLAPAAGLDLRLDDHDATDLLGSRASVLRGLDGLAEGSGHSVLGEELLRLKFHQIHDVPSPFLSATVRGISSRHPRPVTGLARVRACVVLVTPGLRCRACPRSTSAVMWFRRDLRVRDNPALLAALEEGTVHGPLRRSTRRIWSRRRRGPTRLARGQRPGPGRPDPADHPPRRSGARSCRASPVSAACTSPPRPRPTAGAATRPSGERVELVATGSPYAVGPGLVRNGSGGPYQVFTPFARAWREHGWPEPAPTPRSPDLAPADSHQRALDDGAEGGRRGALRPAGRRRGRRLAALARLPPRRARRLLARAQPSRPRRHLAPLALPPPRGDAPAVDARRDRRPLDLRQRAGLARVLRRRAVAHPRLGLDRPQAGAGEDDLRRAGGRHRGMAHRHDRLSPSWTPGCASCCTPAGCTTGSG